MSVGFSATGFLLTGAGRREALLALLRLPDGVFRVPLAGRGREKLAGDGLCGRESAGDEEGLPFLVNFVAPASLGEEPHFLDKELTGEIVRRTAPERIGREDVVEPSGVENLRSVGVFLGRPTATARASTMVVSVALV